MPKKKTELQKAAGKLISAIQKEWGSELGENYAEFSEDVMDRGHNLLQAASIDRMKELLGSLSVTQYLGEVWVQKHPDVKPSVMNLEELLE